MYGVMTKGIYAHIEMHDGMPLLMGREIERLSEDRRTDIARDQYDRGLRAATAKDYNAAVQYFKSASLYKSHPSTTWNIAKSSDDAAAKYYPNSMSSLQEAKRYYEAYREEVPAHERTEDQVDKKIADIERRLKDPALLNRKFWEDAERDAQKSKVQNWWGKNWPWAISGGVVALGLAVLIRRRG
jgi:hypothetical protein